MKRRVQRVLLGLSALSLVLCLGLVASVLGVLRPEAADPELRERRTPERSMVTLASAPAGPRMLSCGVRVRVLDRLDGEILGDAVLSGRIGSAQDGQWYSLEGETDASGEVVLPELPCGLVKLEVSHEHYASWSSDALTQAGDEEQLIVVSLTGTVEVHGTVRSHDGYEPIEGATVSAGSASTLTDDRGRYSLQVPRDRHFLFADAISYGGQSKGIEELMGALGSRDTELGEPVDIELWYQREVEVFCAGMPGDRCDDTMMMCTGAFSPIGDECGHHDDTGRTVCDCPEGMVAVRGGGRSVLVGPEETEAWLDFTDGGHLIGQVELDGLPVLSCDATAVRVPHGLEDLPHGLIAARRVRCDPGGTFRFENLVPGDWELVFETTSLEAEHLERALLPQEVRSGATTDVGVVDFRGGGGIEGTMVDGITGEPLTDAPVLAVRVAERGQRISPLGSSTDHAGFFEMAGLPAGTWRLSHPLSPHAETRVVVEDGAISDGVVVRTSEATSMKSNGFQLASAEEEEGLVVTAVEAGSPAADAGLEEGDLVTGVLLGGFNVSRVAEDYNLELARGVLGHWDGPGVTLVVDREGEEVEVPLDW